MLTCYQFKKYAYEEVVVMCTLCISFCKCRNKLSGLRDNCKNQKDLKQ